MEFFNNETATLLQYFSFPLEVVGFSLAMIEIRFPALALSIIGFMNSYSEDSELVSVKVKWDKTLFRGFLLSTVLGAVMLFLAFVPRALGVFLGDDEGILLLALVGSFLVYGAVYILVIILLMRGLITMANRWVEGRAIGTLGLTIAGFGVLGEAYQFTVQLVI